MATVTLAFPPLPTHVRTARLIAGAMARRTGVPDALLDEVRLAVGEACSRAVDVHRRHCPEASVQVRLYDDERSFRVEILDCAQVGADGQGKPEDELHRFVSIGDDGQIGADGHSLTEEIGRGGSVGLAVIRGLVDDVSLDRGSQGLTVSMRWPAG